MLIFCLSVSLIAFFVKSILVDAVTVGEKYN